MARSAVMNFMKQQGFTQEPFENFYNRFVARRRGRPPLTPAPGPRRFAQGMAAVFMLAAGLTLLRAWGPASSASQGLPAVAFAALPFATFSPGRSVSILRKGTAALA